jgi:glycosyltransferase involved in cell wall biosynthesis
VMCTHNGAPFVREQLDSILNQTVPVNEIHIFDWNSADGTRAIVSQWQAEQSSRAVEVLFHPMMETPGAARSFLAAVQRVVNASRADLVFLADQDDIWMRDKVELFEDRYVGLGFDLAYSDAMIVDSAAAVLRHSFYGSGSPYGRPRPPPTAAILVSNPAIGMTMCLRREWLVSVQPAMKLDWIMHDWALHIMCWLTGGVVQFIDQPLVKYRQHAGNQLGAAQFRSILAQVRRVRTHIASIRSQMGSVSAAHGMLSHSVIDSSSLERMNGRLSRAKLAFSPMLRMRYQWLLGAALMVFWPGGSPGGHGAVR